MNYDEFIKKYSEFNFLKIEEFENINIFKTDMRLMLQVSFKYKDKKLSIDFINAYKIKLRIDGGFIEIGELWIIEKEDGYILSDELKGSSWHCIKKWFKSSFLIL